MGQGCSLRCSTCIMRIIGSSNQPPKPGFADGLTGTNAHGLTHHLDPFEESIGNMFIAVVITSVIIIHYCH